MRFNRIVILSLITLIIYIIGFIIIFTILSDITQTMPSEQKGGEMGIAFFLFLIIYGWILISIYLYIIFTWDDSSDESSNAIGAFLCGLFFSLFGTPFLLIGIALTWRLFITFL